MKPESKICSVTDQARCGVRLNLENFTEVKEGKLGEGIAIIATLHF